jgi:glycosyltransferase involved in cell wall biosynthesis
MAKKLKVAFLTPTLNQAGPETFIRTLCRHFQDCEPVGLAWLGNKFDEGMKNNLQKAVPGLWQGTTEQIVHYACENADVLISWGYSRLPEVTANLTIPVVEVSHTSGEWQAHAHALRNAHKGATHFVAVSEAARTAFPEEIRDKVMVIPNGVEVDRVTPRRGREWQRKEWEIGQGEKVALFYGRLHKIKRVDRLIRAAEHLPEDWTVVIVGEGPERIRLETLVDSFCPIRTRIYPPVNHVGDILAGADVFVLPSECEGHPLTLNEAWLAGVPAVCYEFDFCQEMLGKHGEIMHHVNARHSPEEFAGVIKNAGTDWSKRWGCPRNLAGPVAWQHYTASAMAYRWETYLQGICNAE